MKPISAILVPVGALMIAMVSIQAGASFSKGLFPAVGPEGTTTLRLVLAAIMLALVLRPWRATINGGNWGAVTLYGIILGAMNLCFALAIARIPLGIAAVYLVLIARYMPGSSGGFGSLVEVAQLFSQPGLLLAGWVHYLAFDLFIGAWEVRDAARHRVPHLLVIPCLIMTFLLGPIGLLAYVALRTWKAGTPVPEATA